MRKRGEKSTTRSANINKQVLKVQKIHQRLKNFRYDHINKTVNELAKTRPEFIGVEDLNINGMMKNKHLSKAIAEQNFYRFRTQLQCKCKTLGIYL
jgi:putative transposase